MQLQLNSFIKKGTVMNEYVQVLIKLLVRFLPPFSPIPLTSLRSQRMRQACNHPALITGDSIDDADALDPTPERQPSSSSAGAVKTDDDDLLAALGGMSLSSTSNPVDAGPTCLLCAKPPLHRGTYCSSCADEMAKYNGLTKSTKIQHVLKLLEEIKRESEEEKRRVERENRRKREEVDSDDEDLGAEPVMEKWKPKKTIIFSQVRLYLLTVSRLCCTD